MKRTGQENKKVANLKEVSVETDRRELFWIKGKRQELEVYRVPTKFLYFNIENGRYADKMVQLREDNLGVEIDPRQDKWKNSIWKMLKGEYFGTERDVEPFNKLRDDLVGRTQLRPGVVLFDGGVLDGNRRLAAMLQLQVTEKNPSRFEYLDAVILDADVGPEDRWRIEAGVQIGRDEKHPYSPINELLKIQEGLFLFKGKTSPEKEISRVIYGISEEEVKRDVLKIRLINEYLDFIGKTKAYNEVGEQKIIERFEEAIQTLEQAKKRGTSAPEIAKLKLTLFAIIRDKLMTNWEMREIRTAMGKGKTGKGKNEKALVQLLEIGAKPQKLKEALSTKASISPVHSKHDEITRSFIDKMDAQEKADKPLELANKANTHLNQLLNTLTEGKFSHTSDSMQKLEQLPNVLREVIDVAKKCFLKTADLRKKKSTASTKKLEQGKLF